MRWWWYERKERAPTESFIMAFAALADYVALSPRHQVTENGPGRGSGEMVVCSGNFLCQIVLPMTVPEMRNSMLP